eukprot:362139-Chlamydomonas_euryale.AAC.1
MFEFQRAACRVLYASRTLDAVKQPQAGQDNRKAPSARGRVTLRLCHQPSRPPGRRVPLARPGSATALAASWMRVGRRSSSRRRALARDGHP